MMRITLVSPRIAIQKNDFLGSGIPYWPVEMAVLAAKLQSIQDCVEVLDLFGSDPSSLSDVGDYYLQGRPVNEYLESREIADADIVVVFAMSYMSHTELLSILHSISQRYPTKKLAVLENSQAVTAYSVTKVCDSFFSNGATAVICGEAIHNWDDIESWLLGNSKTRPPNVLADSTDAAIASRLTPSDLSYPVPAWDLFNLSAYWRLPYSHGPKTKSYLPVLTSRGCPYPCDFCVVPETNDKRWRAREPEAVVEEILYLRDHFGVHDFQIEDLNPTVRADRWTRICELLIERQANVRFYIVSGTKAETIRIPQVGLLAEAGCRYLSISPESGSAAVLKQIGKAFKHDHGLDLVRACSHHGIRTQACLLVGHPSETDEDHLKSICYLRELIRSGLDEVAVFVVAPFAGSRLFSSGEIVLRDVTALPSFSPKGRVDYDLCSRRRNQLLRVFFCEQLKNGTKLFRQGVRAIIGRPQTKMENLPRRVIYVLLLVLRARLTPSR